MNSLKRMNGAATSRLPVGSNQGAQTVEGDPGILILTLRANGKKSQQNE
jgi:hypothetical protein